MTRRTFKETLLNEKLYEFTERNKEDNDFGYLQETYRKHIFDRIVQYEKEKRITSEVADDLRYVNFSKVYGDIETYAFIVSNPEELYRFVYSSFKIKNKETFDEFKKLVNLEIAYKLLSSISEIEKGDPLNDKDCAEELGMAKQKFVDLSKKHPEVYNWLKYNVKKNPGRRLAK